MKKNRTLFSCYVSESGYDLTAYINGKPVFIGCANTKYAAESCLFLAEKMLEMAHLYDHAKDFCAPDFDKQHREKQLDKVREIMKPIFANED